MKESVAVAVLVALMASIIMGVALWSIFIRAVAC